MPTTPNHAFDLPTVGSDRNTWGTSLNANWTSLDTKLAGLDPAASAIDTTAGRLLKVGDFGLGTISPPVLDDMNATGTVGGFYTISSPSTGSPPDLFGFLHVLRRGGSQITQVLYSTPGASEVPTQYIRFYDGTTWTAWRAFVEHGSNSNGKYTRFSDGTQICWTDTGPSVACSTAEGSIFASAATDWTLPAAFADTAYVATASPQSDSRWGAARALNTTTVKFTHRAGVSSATSIATRLYAVGRWF